jgi:hypothetical protein
MKEEMMARMEARMDAKNEKFVVLQSIAHRVRAINVGVFTTLGSFACTDWKRKMMVITWTNWHLMR